uniref:Uncharacterized protein n=1 Tax=Rhizophora mucronata TaxID=61149 RepID=A0A2P2QHI9_RHIMU
MFLMHGMRIICLVSVFPLSLASLLPLPFSGF